MMACFDERRRLFISESAGFNLDEKQLAERRPNFIRMIEDTDNDGVFDRSTIFADKLMIPNGAQWLDGALYVAEPPGIWRFTDKDGDGVADQREHLAGNYCRCTGYHAIVDAVEAVAQQRAKGDAR